jgi:hypothetical protein
MVRGGFLFLLGVALIGASFSVGAMEGPGAEEGCLSSEAVSPVTVGGEIAAEKIIGGIDSKASLSGDRPEFRR